MNAAMYKNNKDWLKNIKQRIDNMPQKYAPLHKNIKDTEGLLEKMNARIMLQNDLIQDAFELITSLYVSNDNLVEEVYKLSQKIERQK